MQINLSYDTSVGNLSPSDQVLFEAAMRASADAIAGVIANNITVTLAVGYGEAGGYPGGTLDLITDPTTLAEAGPTAEYILYGPLRSGLQNSSNLAAVNAAFAALPVNEPAAWGGVNLYTSKAEIKALGGDVAPGSIEIDGNIGVSSTAKFDYDTTGAPVPADEYSFMGVAEHELAHALGRFSFTPTFYSPLDLFRYAAPGVLAGLGGTPAYFSLDNGTTDLNDFDTASDYSDWLGTIGGNPTLDSFNAFETAGKVLPITMVDRLELGALGFKINLGTVSWTGGAGNTDFDNAGNWDALQVPDASTDLSIGGATVYVSNPGTEQADSIQIGAGGVLGVDAGLFIIAGGAPSTNAGEFDVNAAGTEVTVYLAGSIDNTGRIGLQGPDAHVVTNSTTVTVGGSGTIAMLRANIGGRTFSDASPDDTFVSTNLIHGSGVIGLDGFLNALTFVNEGTVRADDVYPLTIQGGVVNKGLLDGASKFAPFTLGGSIDNTAGQITVEDGTTLDLNSVTLTGGVLTALGTGKIEVSGTSALDGTNPSGAGTAAGLTFSGGLVLDAASSLTLGGAIAGDTIDATQGQLHLLPSARLTGVSMKGHIALGGGGGAVLYASSYFAAKEGDIGGMEVSGALTLAPNPDGFNGFANSGTFTIDAGGDLNIYQTVGIAGGTIKMNDPTSLITGTPGGGGFQLNDWLVLGSTTVTGVGIITGLEIWATTSSTIMANGGTLYLESGADLVTRGGTKFPEETVSDGWIGAAAGSDLVIMGYLDLQPDIIDGSSPGGAFSGAGTITLGGSIITGAKAGTIVGGSIDAGRTIEVAAPGGGLDRTTVHGEIDVNGGALLTLYGGQQVNASGQTGTVTNTGLIALNGALDGNSIYQAATLTTAGDVYVPGGGTIRLESNGGTGDDQIISVTNFDTLENAGTIAGVGTLGGSYLNLTNDSVIAADGVGHTLVVDGGSLNGTAGAIYNNGLMEATNGATLLVNSAIVNYGIQFFDPIDFPNGVPTGGGDIGASGHNSVVLLNNGGITAGRLFTEGGGQIEIVGNATLGAGPVLIPQGTATQLGNTDIVVNSNTTGRQSDGAVAGLTDGRMVVAWSDYSANANGPGTPDPITGAILYPPIARFTVMGAFGVRMTAGDLAVQQPPVGQQQTDPRTAALPNGGFIITWLQSNLGGGGTTLQGATFYADLTPYGSGFSLPVSGSGSAAQDVAGMPDGGFIVVWADAASPGTASPIHLERFTKSGVGGAIVNIATGVQPRVALAGNGSGAYAVTWTVPGAAEGTVYAQFYSAAGVAAGGPVTVATGNGAYIAPGQNGNAFIVFWSDPAGHPGILQGQEFQSNGQLSGVGINTAAELDYGGSYTASSGALPDGRIATAQSISRNGSLGYTDVGVQFSATRANTYSLVSYANIVVEPGHTLTLQKGMENAGTIVVSGAGATALAASGSVTVNGNGTIVLGGPTDQIVGAKGADTLINQGNTIMGQGSIGGGKLNFTNQGIVSASSGTLAIGGGGTLLNNSVMKSAGGALVINGPVINEGYIESTGANGKVVINGPVQSNGFFTGYLEVLGGEMDLNGSVDASQYIFFSSTDPSMLVLSDPSHMKGNILFMNVGDTIDVTSVAATSFNYDQNGGSSGNGVLNLMAGATTLAALGMWGTAYPGSLVIASDNHGGTLVELASTTQLGNGANVAVASLPGGGFVEVFQYVPFFGATPGGVYVQLFDANQNYAGFLSVDGSGEQPAVAAQRGGDFMVVWVNPTTHTIQGQILAADGTLLKNTFNLTQPVAGWTQTHPTVTVAEGSGSSEQYELAYETDNASTSSHAIVFETLDANGVPIGVPIIVTPSTVDLLGVLYVLDSPVTPRAVALKLSSPIQAAVYQAIAHAEGDPTEFNVVMGEFVSGGGASGAPLGGNEAAAITSSSATPVTIMFTPASSNLTYASPEIAALSNGEIVAVWDQIAPGDATWTVAGQVVTSAGVFVGSQFTLATTLPAASTPGRPTINALPNGEFVVTYNSAATSVSGQKYDALGNPIGGPFAISNSSGADSATTVLSDGTLLTVSGTGGNVTANTSAIQAAGATWSGATGTNLGTAGNWSPTVLPDATQTLTFNVANGGTLTGSATGMNAAFSGAGAWLLQNATLSLAGETLAPGSVLALTENSALTVSGGSIAATGSLDIETTTGVAMTVLGSAQVSANGMTLGIGGSQTGTLAVSGAGTAIHNTGTNGAVELGGSGTGQLNITAGATVTASAGATLGVNGTGNGALSVSGSGSLFNETGELDVGVAGTGLVSISAQGAVKTGNNPAALSQGVDIAGSSGGSGGVTVTGTGSSLSNTGRFVVGDAGVGSLAVAAGGVVTTTPGAAPGLAGLVVANASGGSGSSVNVSGAGSNLQITGSLIVGEAGFGQLSVSQGASVTADSLDAGALTGGVGVVVISGAGSSLTTTGSLSVGDGGAGELSILNGANVTIGGDLDVASGPGGSGNVDIENTTGLTIINGNLNVGLGGGSATMTIGLNTQVQFDNGGISEGKFAKIIQHTAFDPAFLATGGGGFALPTGTSAFKAYVNNPAGQITQDAAGDLTVLQTPTIYGAGGTFQIATGGAALTLEADGVTGQTFQFTDNTGTLVIGIDQLTTIDTPASGTGPFTLVANPNFGKDLIGGFGGIVSGFVAGDVIKVNTTASAGFTLNGSIISVVDNVGGATEGTIAFANASMASLAASTSGALVDQVACFAEGTLIETVNGPVAVEHLAVGDDVRTLSGAAAIVWLGQRAVDCARHPKPETVWPVRVCAGAFGMNVPKRDLYLSPDHAVFVNDVLVPVKLLINGTSIAQVKRNRVRYFHVELPDHAVILAEGLPVESYLDIGDRANFADNGTIRLFPDFATRLTPDAARLWESKGVAPLVLAGAKLAAARRAIARYARSGPTRRPALAAR